MRGTDACLFEPLLPNEQESPLLSLCDQAYAVQNAEFGSVSMAAKKNPNITLMSRIQERGTKGLYPGAELGS